MIGSMEIRIGLLLLRLAIIGFLVGGMLLGGPGLEPWVIAGALLFLTSLVVSLVLGLVAERRSVNG